MIINRDNPKLNLFSLCLIVKRNILYMDVCKIIMITFSLARQCVMFQNKDQQDYKIKPCLSLFQ